MKRGSAVTAPFELKNNTAPALSINTNLAASVRGGLVAVDVVLTDLSSDPC